jgi:ElaB/YqjD/DUF883 family membrane-anchored ribosome-binding protein
VIGDLQTRIGSLTQDLSGISKTIQDEQAKLSAELRESQKGAVDLVQGRIDSLTDELKGVSDSVGQEAAQTTETLRGEREQIVNNLEAQIGTLKEQVQTLPVDEIQNRINEIAEQSDNFVASASEERAQLASQIASLEERGITQEDLASALQDRASLQDLQNLQTAVQTGSEQRGGLQEQIQALQQAQLDPANIQQERQAAITTAIDPIQQQLQQIQGSIPEQIDVDALRQQITQEVLAGLPQPTTTVQAPTVSVGPGAGGMDPYGQGGGYSTRPTTEGAQEFQNYVADRNLTGQTPITGVARPADPVGIVPPDPVTNVAIQAPTQTAQQQAGIAPPPRFKNMPLGRVSIR